MATTQDDADGDSTPAGGNSTNSRELVTDARRVTNGRETLVSIEVEHEDICGAILVPEDVDDTDLAGFLEEFREHAEQVQAGEAVVADVSTSQEGER